MTEDSVVLKKATDRVEEKFEIIGLNIINLTKFKQETNERLEKLEKLMPKCYTIDSFREDSQT